MLDDQPWGRFAGGRRCHCRWGGALATLVQSKYGLLTQEATKAPQQSNNVTFSLMEKAAAQHIPSHLSNLQTTNPQCPQISRRQGWSLNMASLLGLQGLPYKGGDGEWTFPVPLSDSLYMASFSRKKDGDAHEM